MSSVQRIGRGPVGFPFSTITVAGGTFHVSGQVAQDPSTGRIESPQCYEQSLVLVKVVLLLVPLEVFQLGYLLLPVHLHHQGMP